MAGSCDPLAVRRGAVRAAGGGMAGVHPLDHDGAGGGAVRAAGRGQRAFPLGIAPDRASDAGRFGHYRRGAGGGAHPQRLAGAGDLGLFRDVGNGCST